MQKTLRQLLILLVLFSGAAARSASGLQLGITSFSATCEGKTVKLEYTIAAEYENEKVIIEKTIDGIEWQEVYQRTCVTRHNGTETFSVAELPDVTGIIYYRILVVNIMGDRKIYYTVFVETKLQENDVVNFDIYPNPASSQDVQFRMVTTKISDAELLIFDHNGRIIHTGSLQLSSGHHPIMFTNRLSPGVYRIVLRSEKSATVINKIFIVQ